MSFPGNGHFSTSSMLLYEQQRSSATLNLVRGQSSVQYINRLLIVYSRWMLAGNSYDCSAVYRQWIMSSPILRLNPEMLIIPVNRANALLSHQHISRKWEKSPVRLIAWTVCACSDTTVIASWSRCHRSASHLKFWNTNNTIHTVFRLILSGFIIAAALHWLYRCDQYKIAS